MSAQVTKKNIEEERKFILEFIDVYHSLTALWDVKSRDYSDRHKKEKQYGIVLKKYRERYPQAERKDVCKKIQILRSNFKRELKRLNHLEIGTGVENETKLWYFDALSFIKDIEAPNSCRSSLNGKHSTHKQTITKPNALKEMVRLVSQRLKEPQNALTKAGEIWAIKLQEMDHNQALIAEKLINDILFSGRLDQLDLRSSIVTSDRTSTQISPMNTE